MMLKQISTKQFIQVLREASPYINSLRGKKIVIGINSYIVEDAQLINLVQDITLLSSLGMKLVIVFGVFKQVEELADNVVGSVNKKQLNMIKELIGRIRFDIESYLSIGYANLSISRSKINVLGANYILAKSKGIVSGKDTEYLGEIRKINLDLLNTHLNQGNIILVNPLGYSVSGITYYIPMSEMAAELAIVLNAEKLIFITRANGIIGLDDNILNNLTLTEAQKIMLSKIQHEDIIHIFHSLEKALSSNHIKRVQLISGLQDGSLLAELFTRDGIGTSLSHYSFTNIRKACSTDIPSLLQIVSPLVEKGFLLARPKSYFESNIKNFFVLEFDEFIYGCVQFKSLTNDSAELACLAVLESVRDAGYGEALLVKIIEEAKNKGKKRLFALTTQAADWFQERGFIEVSPKELPANRLLEYQASNRQSKVFSKNLI